MAPNELTEVYALELAGDGKLYSAKELQGQGKFVPYDDPKYDEWSFKLGALMKAQLGLEADKRYFLILPKHWHLRKKEGQSSAKKREDFYLHGHFLSPSKNFRSPAEAVVHFIWVISGSEDPRDCACPHCKTWCKEQRSSAAATGFFQAVQPAVPAPVPIPVSTPAPLPAPVPAPVPTSVPAVSLPALVPQPGAQHVGSIAPTSLPSANIQQNIGLSVQDSNIFRPGELVWFRSNNPWRLGLVIFPVDNNLYRLQPIGHEQVQKEQVDKNEADMRPFLAFSVPPVNDANLRSRSFNTVPWAAFLQNIGDNRGQRDILTLEASKMAACQIDHSFSAFDPLHATDGMEHYGGIFLGAEKILRGEPVRIRWDSPELKNMTGPRGVVLLVMDIVVKEKTQLLFLGDVYWLEEKGMGTPGTGNSHLPAIMIREKMWRDSITRFKNSIWEWRCLKPAVSLEEKQIRGRYYETERILSIIARDRLDAAMIRGEVEDAQGFLNSRLESSANYTGRTAERSEAFGASVPRECWLQIAQGNNGIAQ